MLKSKFGNPQGVESHVVRKLLHNIKRGRIGSSEDLDAEINRCMEVLESWRSELHAALDVSASCEHEYNHSHYRMRNVVGDATVVYERACKYCGYTESHRGTESAPSWVDALISRERIIHLPN